VAVRSFPNFSPDGAAVLPGLRSQQLSAPSPRTLCPLQSTSNKDAPPFALPPPVGTVPHAASPPARSFGAFGVFARRACALSQVGPAEIPENARQQALHLGWAAKNSDKKRGGISSLKFVGRSPNLHQFFIFGHEINITLPPISIVTIL